MIEQIAWLMVHHPFAVILVCAASFGLLVWSYVWWLARKPPSRQPDAQLRSRRMAQWAGYALIGWTVMMIVVAASRLQVMDAFTPAILGYCFLAWWSMACLLWGTRRVLRAWGEPMLEYAPKN